jgi:hypothetical protein
MRCKDNYRLELHWDSIEYHNDFVAKLNGAQFSGAALKDAQKINGKDHIDLDLTPQHLVVLNSYYIVRLEWAAVEYLSNGKVNLGGATLTNEHLRVLHKLESKDHIIINTEKHEHTTHASYMVYEAAVHRPDKSPYEYTK